MKCPSTSRKYWAISFNLICWSNVIAATLSKSSALCYVSLHDWSIWCLSFFFFVSCRLLYTYRLKRFPARFLFWFLVIFLSVECMWSSESYDIYVVHDYHRLRCSGTSDICYHMIRLEGGVWIDTASNRRNTALRWKIQGRWDRGFVSVSVVECYIPR